MFRLGIFLSLLMSIHCFANQLEVSINEVAQIGPGKKIGTMTIVETSNGLLFKPSLKGFNPKPKLRGFHVHRGNSCDNFGLAAQGHLDPKNTQKHLGPYDVNGHLGDIQMLIINNDGTISLPVFAPKLNIAAIEGYTLIIHANEDNYMEKPRPNGGSGDRVACGIIPKSKTQASTKLKPAQLTPTEVASSPPPSAEMQQLIQRKKKLQQFTGTKQTTIKNSTATRLIFIKMFSAN